MWLMHRVFGLGLALSVGMGLLGGSAVYAQTQAQTQAQTPESQAAVLTFQDQWGQSHALNQKTRWVVYSHHMAGNDWVKGAFQQLKLQDLDRHQLLYVADISGMPSLVSKWMAVPAMQEYAFPIALVRDSERLADWPRVQDQVSVFEYQAGQRVAEHAFASREALQIFLSLNVLSDDD